MEGRLDARAGLGKIKARDNGSLWGTDAECKLRQPDDPFYKKFAAECSRVQIAVDMFAMGCVTLHDCSLLPESQHIRLRLSISLRKSSNVAMHLVAVNDGAFSRDHHRLAQSSPTIKVIQWTRPASLNAFHEQSPVPHCFLLSVVPKNMAASACSTHEAVPRVKHLGSLDP